MYKKFHMLCEDAKRIREEVFVQEQGFQNEIDALDETATHLVFYDGDTPVGTCRYYLESQDGVYHVGRVAVVKEYRGKNMGRHIMETLEQLIASEGGQKVVLSAQVRVRGFYEKSGYIAVGDTYYEEKCEHIFMEKVLKG